MNFPSKVLEKAVEEISGLPGIGKKSALRLALHLLRQPQSQGVALGNALQKLVTDIKYCQECHNFSDEDICEICSNTKRSDEILCIVEDVRDVMAIENMGGYKGVYHVLHGVLSPLDGIGPDNIRIRELIFRLQQSQVKEVIIATNSDVEGEATAVYLAQLLKPIGVTVSRIAHGLPVGGDLEYADEMTLARALENRRNM